MVLMVAGNTITASVFGVAAFAQPALGRAFLSGQTVAQDLYGDIYSAPLLISVGIGLLLFIAGAVVGGFAIANSGILPRWAGWLIAAAVPVFAISNILLPAVLQTVAAVALLIAAVSVAWSADRRSREPFRTQRAVHA